MDVGGRATQDAESGFHVIARNPHRRHATRERSFKPWLQFLMRSFITLFRILFCRHLVIYADILRLTSLQLRFVICLSSLPHSSQC